MIYPVIALFVPAAAPLHDMVSPAPVFSKMDGDNDTLVGAVGAVTKSGEDKTVYALVSMTPEVSGARPSDTTRNRTAWVVLAVVDGQVTDTVLIRGVVPVQLSLSFALIRTELETPLTVMVQFSASPEPMPDEACPNAADMVKL